MAQSKKRAVGSNHRPHFAVPEWEPEIKLAAAVFASGILNKDELWLNDKSREYAYSFLNLCDLFCVEPGWVYRQLARRTPDKQRMDSLNP